jgi:FkbM family methyltransferase
LNIGSVSLIPGIQKVTRVAYSKTETEDVGMTTIDALALPGRCAFIKLDVEGFESEVIAGARAFLEANGFPPILFEEWRKGKFTGAVGEEINQRRSGQAGL